MGTILQTTDMDALGLGVRILSSGGGGTTRLAILLAKHELATHGPVQLLNVETFQGRAAVIGMVGAPQVDDEKLPSGAELECAVHALQRSTGRIDALAVLEIGGSNGLFPVATAARLGLPLVDFDLMGRAFPKLSQSTLSTSRDNIHSTFAVFANPFHKYAVVPGNDIGFVEQMAETMNRVFGGVSALAYGPLGMEPGSDQSVVAGSIDRALRFGQALMGSGDMENFARFAHEEGCLFQCRGKVIDIALERDAETTSRGIYTLQVTHPERKYVRIDFQAEFLLVSTDGVLVGATPQTIAVLSGQTMEPLSPQEIVYGQDVAVFVFPAADVWDGSDLKPLVSPAAFGYTAID